MKRMTKAQRRQRKAVEWGRGNPHAHWRKCAKCWKWYEHRYYKRYKGADPSHLCSFDSSSPGWWYIHYFAVGIRAFKKVWMPYRDEHPFWRKKPASARFLRNDQRQKRKERHLGRSSTVGSSR